MDVLATRAFHERLGRVYPYAWASPAVRRGGRTAAVMVSDSSPQTADDDRKGGGDTAAGATPSAAAAAALALQRVSVISSVGMRSGGGESIGRSDPLCRAAAKRPTDRSREEHDLVVAFLRTVPALNFFVTPLSEQLLDDLAANCSLQWFHVGEVLFTASPETNRRTYVVVRGAVTVGRAVVTLTRGDVIDAGVHEFSARATSAWTGVFIFESHTAQQLLEKYVTVKYARVNRFLRLESEWFGRLGVRDLAQLRAGMVVKHFSAFSQDMFLVRGGTQAKAVFIVLHVGNTLSSLRVGQVVGLRELLAHRCFEESVIAHEGLVVLVIRRGTVMRVKDRLGRMLADAERKERERAKQERLRRLRGELLTSTYEQDAKEAEEKKKKQKKKTKSGARADADADDDDDELSDGDSNDDDGGGVVVVDDDDGRVNTAKPRLVYRRPLRHVMTGERRRLQMRKHDLLQVQQQQQEQQQEKKKKTENAPGVLRPQPPPPPATELTKAQAFLAGLVAKKAAEEKSLHDIVSERPGTPPRHQTQDENGSGSLAAMASAARERRKKKKTKKTKLYRSSRAFQNAVIL